eukprot:2160901-Pleurochrysis_carterae.AAC.1
MDRGEVAATAAWAQRFRGRKGERECVSGKEGGREGGREIRRGGARLCGVVGVPDGGESGCGGDERVVRERARRCVRRRQEPDTHRGVADMARVRPGACACCRWPCACFSAEQSHVRVTSKTNASAEGEGRAHPRDATERPLDQGLSLPRVRRFRPDWRDVCERGGALGLQVGGGGGGGMKGEPVAP